MDKWADLAVKRRTFKLCVFVLLGAILNVAVAWNFSRGTSLKTAAWADRDSWPHLAGDTQTRWWYDNVPSTFTSIPVLQSTPVHCAGIEAECIWADVAGDTRFEADDEKRVTLIHASGWPLFFDYALVARAGWPCRSMCGGRFVHDNNYPGSLYFVLIDRPSRSDEILVSALRMNSKDQRDVAYRMLPTGIIPSGFAINTIFYAVILWLLFAFPFAIRRHRRIKRGLCPACAYPVGDRDVCTECGKPVKA